MPPAREKESADRGGARQARQMVAALVRARGACEARTVEARVAVTGSHAAVAQLALRAAVSDARTLAAATSRAIEAVLPKIGLTELGRDLDVQTARVVLVSVGTRVPGSTTSFEFSGDKVAERGGGFVS